nr:hypothetical protein [Desulfobacula sp.]
MALDEPKDTDDTFDVKGLKFVVDKEFMEKAETIKIDLRGWDFILIPTWIWENPAAEAAAPAAPAGINSFFGFWKGRKAHLPFPPVSGSSPAQESPMPDLTLVRHHDSHDDHAQHLRIVGTPI